MFQRDVFPVKAADQPDLVRRVVAARQNRQRPVVGKFGAGGDAVRKLRVELHHALLAMAETGENGFRAVRAGQRQAAAVGAGFKLQPGEASFVGVEPVALPGQGAPRGSEDRERQPGDPFRKASGGSRIGGQRSRGHRREQVLPDQVQHLLHIAEAAGDGEDRILLRHHQRVLPERAVAAECVVAATPELETVADPPVGLVVHRIVDLE